MSNENYALLGQHLSAILLAFLDQLLIGNKPASFLPGGNLASLVWDILSPYISSEDSLSERLSTISFRSDVDEAGVLLAWELEQLLPGLSPTDFNQIVDILEENPFTDELMGTGEEETAEEGASGGKSPVTWRSWEPEESPPSEPEGEVLRGWDPDKPPIGSEPLAGLTAETTAEESPPEGKTRRFIRAEITEGDHQKPLPPNQEFTLALFIDLEAGGDFDAALRFEEELAFSPGESVARLYVIISSQDFIIHTRSPQELRIPLNGPSRNKARFDLEPKEDWTGVGEVTALFYKDNNFIQGMTIQLNVGIGQNVFPVQPVGLGRPLEGLGILQPRDVLLFIKRVADGFDLTMVGSVAAQAFLPITPGALNEIVSQARNAIQEVVFIKAGAKYPFQSDIDIPTEISLAGIQKLAKAGWMLFRNIFHAPGTRADAHAMGEKLLTLAQENPLKLQIVSEQFFLPWGLLYMAKRVELDNIESDRFLGMKHIIEHIPLQNRMQVHDELIPSKPKLSVSLNLDTRIDSAFQIKVVAEQREYWEQWAASRDMSLELRQNSNEFINGLVDAPEQILYFYGHAVSKDLVDEGGPSSSSLSFSDDKLVTLEDLQFQAPTDLQLEGNPLVFVNACESAELSPLFYGGFMPYFVEKGARGMIGTECQVPALFAAEWARRFFTRFLFDERPIGELFLELRREFFIQHNNPLGLVYALYCDGDTRITPRLAPI